MSGLSSTPLGALAYPQSQRLDRRTLPIKAAMYCKATRAIRTSARHSRQKALVHVVGAS